MPSPSFTSMEQIHTVESLLSDKDLRMDFIFYVNKIHAQESLLFWMEVEMFKRIVDSDECYKYVHTNARSQVNVEGKLKTQLEATMATGIWDQTLFNDIQNSVQECLKFSVVRSFGEYITKKRSIHDPTKQTPAHVMLGRYECALHRHQHQKSYGTMRTKGPNALGWLKKKTASTIVHSEKPERPQKKEKKSSFLGKYKKVKTDPPTATVSLDPPTSDEEDNICVACQEQEALVEQTATPEERLAHRERLTQQRLQQQIQILRNLHQRQAEIFEDANSPSQPSTVEFTPASSSSSPLTKSVSMPSIINRGVSVISLKHKN